MDGSRVIETVARMKSGDRQAFEELYGLTHDRVYFLALKMVRNHEDALEVVQETYLSVYKSLDRLIKPEVFNAWLSKIVVNKCRDSLGRPKEVLLAENEDFEDKDAIEAIEDTANDFIPPEALDRSETRSMIMALIDNLPDAQRTTLLLHYYQGLNVEAIASIMECPAATVKSRLVYARRQIRTGVEGYEKQGVKLYNVAVVPLIIYILEEQAKDNALGPATAAKILSAVHEGTHAAAAHTATGASKFRLLQKYAALSVRTKIAAGIVAGAVAISAITIPIAVTANRNSSAGSSMLKQPTSGDQSGLSSTANNFYSKTSDLEKDTQDEADAAYNTKIQEYINSSSYYDKFSSCYRKKELSYAKYDIDKDGIPELIVKTGTCEADMTNYVYTYKNRKLIDAGSFSGGHQNSYALSDQNGILSEMCHMEYEMVSKITLYNDTINASTIIQKNVGNAGYDELPNLITMTIVF